LLFIRSCADLDHSSLIARLFWFIILLVAAWFFPDGFYDVYVNIARVISGFFLVLQVIILVDFAYRWNEDWLSDEKQYYKGILFVASLLYIGSLVLLVFLFIWFSSSGCRLETFFIVWTLIMTLIISLLSVWERVTDNNRGGLLPAGIITLYSYYLCWSSLSDNPSTCNTMNSDDTVHLVIGLIIAGASVSYAGYSIYSSDLMGGQHDESVRSSLDLEANKDEKSEAAIPKSPSINKKSEVHVDDETVKRNKKFHLCMAVSAMYMAMLLTNWGSRDRAEDDTSSSSYDISRENMWIKIVTQWITIGTYGWTLLAPVILPDRDWS